MLINAFFFHSKICICDLIYHTNGIGSLKKRSTPEELSNLALKDRGGEKLSA